MELERKVEIDQVPQELQDGSTPLNPQEALQLVQYGIHLETMDELKIQKEMED